VGIGALLDGVAATDAIPVARADARAVDGARGSADRAVVLRAAADVIEGARVVGRDPVELRQRQIGEVPPRLHAVIRFVQATVAAHEHVARVAWIPENLVKVDVHTGHRNDPPGLAAVLAAPDVCLRRIHRLGVVRIDDDLIVVAGVAAAIPVLRTGLRVGASLRRVISRAGSAATAVPLYASLSASTAIPLYP